MKQASPKFIAKPRCIYTGQELKEGHPKLKPSHEHLIPLSLGGSNGFTTDDVSAEANSKASREIDDAVASFLPILMLRHRYGLRGHRKTVPNVKLKGEFLDINTPARLDIGADGKLSFEFEDEQHIQGNLITLQSTEDRVRFLLKGRLEQAKKRKVPLITPYGEITDEEDIEVSLLLAEQKQGKEFKGQITIDLIDYHFALVRLMVKIAIGLGHRVLGPRWTFSPGGHRLRQNLWRKPSDRNIPEIAGTLQADLPESFANVIGLTAHYHIMGVFSVKKRTAAMISLFGGELGTAIIDLGYDSRPIFNKYIKTGQPFKSVFTIPLKASVGERKLQTISFQEIADFACNLNLIPPNRAAMQFELEKKKT